MVADHADGVFRPLAPALCALNERGESSLGQQRVPRLRAGSCAVKLIIVNFARTRSLVSRGARQFEPCAGRCHPVQPAFNGIGNCAGGSYTQAAPKRLQECSQNPRRVMPMSSQRSHVSKPATRRKFLAGAAITGAATVAMPQVSRAQTTTWKYQSTWPTKDIFHEYAVDYAKKVNEMSGGRLKLDVLAAGAVVPAFQMQDAVQSGILDPGHGVCAYWYGKHKAYSLFGTAPSWGWDSHGLLAWFYYGGGEALYKELVNDILKLNLTGFLYFPMPTQPLGWFKKPVTGPDDLKNIKYRTVGLSADLFKELGASVTILPGGEIVPALDRGLIDAAEFNNPSSDLLLGFPD